MRTMTSAHYAAVSEQFRRRLRDEAGKPVGDQRYPEHAQWPGADVIATCRTPGCPNDGVGFEAQAKENADGIYRVYCGKCGRQITDLIPQFADGAGEVLPTDAEMVARQASR